MSPAPQKVSLNAADWWKFVGAFVLQGAVFYVTMEVRMAVVETKLTFVVEQLADAKRDLRQFAADVAAVRSRDQAIRAN